MIGDFLKVADHKATRLAVPMIVALLMLVWLTSFFIPPVPHLLLPSAALHYWLSQLNLSEPSWVSNLSMWLRTHTVLMKGVAITGGAMINGSALQASPLRNGGATVIAWPCLLLAAEALGVHATLGKALWGFLPFPILAVVLAMFKAEHFSWSTVSSGLGRNLIHFVFLPFLPVLMVPWLILSYSDSPEGLGRD